MVILGVSFWAHALNLIIIGLGLFLMLVVLIHAVKVADWPVLLGERAAPAPLVPRPAMRLLA